MTTVEDRKKRRTDFLVGLYEAADGNTGRLITYHQIAEASGLPADNDIFDIAQNLHSSGFLQMATSGGMMGAVAITAAGVQEAERIIEAQEEAGQPRYFSLAVLTDQQVRAALEPLVASIREQIEGLGSDVDPDAKADLASDLDSATDQLRAATPNRGVIKAALGRINSILPGVAKVTAELTVIAGGITEVLHGLGI
jgi:hypothetical protein